MTLQLTNKEAFLISTAIYLYTGGDRANNELRNEDEVQAILHDKDSFKDIDVIKDELSYFGLDIDDFKWQQLGIWDRQLDCFKKGWTGYDSKLELKLDFEAYMKEEMKHCNSLENSVIGSDEVLWDLFEYDIREVDDI